MAVILIGTAGLYVQSLVAEEHKTDNVRVRTPALHTEGRTVQDLEPNQKTESATAIPVQVTKIVTFFLALESFVYT